jgi:hypothetical protein
LCRRQTLPTTQNLSERYFVNHNKPPNRICL